MRQPNQIKFQADNVEQSLENDPLDPARTFLTQHAHQKKVISLKQSGMSLDDIKRFLSDPSNVNKLNQGLVKKFVNLEHSLQNTKTNHLALELKQGSQKVSVHLKAEKDSAGGDLTTYSLDNASKDDLSSIKSICRLAIFSAAASNQPTEFTVNEHNPHKDTIKQYLKSALEEVASRNPEAAKQLTINGSPLEANRRKSPGFGV